MTRFPPEFIRNPYPIYDALRSSEPLYWAGDEQPMWLVTNYQDAVAVLRDSRFGRNLEESRAVRELLPTRPDIRVLLRGLDAAILFCDPPRHTPMRRSVIRALRAALEAVPSNAEDLATASFRRLDSQSIDVVNQVAVPLTAAFVCDLFGFPRKDWSLLRAWSSAIAQVSESALDTSIVSEVIESRAAFRSYVDSLLESERTGLASVLFASQRVDGLSRSDVVANIILLFSASFETTVGAIGNAFRALATHPELIAELRRAPIDLSNAIDELIRFDAPVQLCARVVREDVMFGSSCVAAGDLVVTLLGAANRDPAQFSNPNKIDLSRSNSASHLGFGTGTHACVGAAIARQQLHGVLKAALSTFEGWRLASDADEYMSTITLRRLATLELAFTP